MNATDKIDAARIELLLGELRLPGIKLIWTALAETADKEGWPAARFLAALAEQEMVERSRRRFERHLEEARLPPGKTLEAFDFDAVPMISKAQVQALAAGDAWLEKGANLLCFGPPGGGKSHLAAALGMALIEKGWRVLFTRTTDLVQKLQIARRDLALEAAIAKLDKYHLLILDDLAYVTKDQAETSVLFELISARYERRSMLITANQPFGEWGKIFPDQAMTLAAIDRLVHHATILEMNVDSYRRKEAVDKARGAGRPPTRATIKGSSCSLRNRHQGPSSMGFEDEAEQSFGRPCRLTDSRSKQTYELASSIVPRGTSFHRSVELECSPVAFDSDGSHPAVASRVHRNSVPSTQMRCMITANRRASATIAFFIPRCLAIFMAQALSQDHFAKRTSMI